MCNYRYTNTDTYLVLQRLRNTLFIHTNTYSPFRRSFSLQQKPKMTLMMTYIHCTVFCIQSLLLWFCVCLFCFSIIFFFFLFDLSHTVDDYTDDNHSIYYSAPQNKAYTDMFSSVFDFLG